MLKYSVVFTSVGIISLSYWVYKKDTENQELLNVIEQKDTENQELTESYCSFEHD